LVKSSSNRALARATCRDAFPYDFGFVPSTKAEDGDPVDVLVLMDEPAFPGCLLQCRVIGVIEGEEASKKEKVRNDRIVAVEKANHSFGNVDHIHELGKKFVKELEDFSSTITRFRERNMEFST
jgi:inorganic pyrophosphatase